MPVVVAFAGLVLVAATFLAVIRNALERDQMRELEVVGARMS